MKFGSIFGVMVVAATNSAFAEIDDVHDYDNQYGINKGFCVFERVEWCEQHLLAFHVKDFKNFMITHRYPLPLLSIEGEDVTNDVVCLRRGESIWHGDRVVGREVLSYISGKDIPGDINCPEEYRKAEDVIHYFDSGKHGDCEDILFDVKRKKQFNVYHPHEYDYPFFPYLKGMVKRDYDVQMRKVCTRIGEIAQNAFDRCDRGVENVWLFMAFSIDYVVRETQDMIYAGNVTLSTKIIDDDGAEIVLDKIPDSAFYQSSMNTITNLIVSAKNIGGKWKVFGVVTQMANSDLRGLFSEPNCLIFDEDGKLIAAQGLSNWDKNAEFVKMRNEAFDWVGEFSVERLKERVAIDAGRMKKGW